MSDRFFSDIQGYALGTYFKALPADRQKAIYNAYVKVENNTASTDDMKLVIEYYNEVKKAWYANFSRIYKLCSGIINMTADERANLVSMITANVSEKDNPALSKFLTAIRKIDM